MAVIHVRIDRGQIRNFERGMRDLGSKRIPRAIQFALNGVAIDVSNQGDKLMVEPVGYEGAFAAEGLVVKTLWHRIEA